MTSRDITTAALLFLAFAVWPLVATAQFVINPYAFDAAASPTYLVEENFVLTTNTAPTGWSQSGSSVTWNYDTAPAPLEGIRSLALNTSSNVTTVTFAAQTTVHLYCIMNHASSFSVNSDAIQFRSSVGAVATLQRRSSNVWRLNYGSTNSSTLAPISGTSHIWITVDSSGNMTFRDSVNDTNPGADEITLTGGTGGASIESISFFAPSSNLTIVDKVRADDVAIGSSPP